MVKVLIPIADGTEELEAITLIDILRRADAQVTIASVMDHRKTVITSHGVKIEADCLLDGCQNDSWDLIALPGGMPGAENLGESSILVAMLKEQLVSGRLTAAICASPAVALAENSLINGRSATCYPAFEQRLQNAGAVLKCGDVVVNENLVTGSGPGTAMQFALKLVECLFGNDKAKAVAEAALVR